MAAVQANLETANSSLAAANEKCASLEVDLAAVKDGAEATNAQLEEIKNQLKKVAELEKKLRCRLFYVCKIISFARFPLLNLKRKISSLVRRLPILQIESSSQGKRLYLNDCRGYYN